MSQREVLLFDAWARNIERMFPLMPAVREMVPAPASLSPAGLIDVMADLHRVESVLAERKLAVIAAFADHRICAAARDDLSFVAPRSPKRRWAPR